MQFILSFTTTELACAELAEVSKGHIPNYYYYDKPNVVQFILSFATTELACAELAEVSKGHTPNVSCQKYLIYRVLQTIKAILYINRKLPNESINNPFSSLYLLYFKTRYSLL